jgi:arabinofuranosyltransferase
MLASQARVERSQAVAALVLGGAALLSVPTLAVTLGSPADYRDQRISASGIADERGHYYWALGLRPVLQAGSWQVHPWLQEGQALAAQPAHYVRCTVGMVAQAAGPQAYWVDPLALTDAFLARLPARASTRIGHAERALPPGYLPALLGDSSGLPPALRPLFDDVRRVTRDPLLDLPRLQALLRLLRTPLPVRAPGYDPDAAHLPGLRATRQDQLSCLGIPIGSDLIWKFEGPPLMLSNERPLEPAR